jgi:hypothetical protein
MNCLGGVGRWPEHLLRRKEELFARTRMFRGKEEGKDLAGDYPALPLTELKLREEIFLRVIAEILTDIGREPSPTENRQS